MEPSQDLKVKSLAKALRVLECFTVQQPELGITELAERMQVTKSNVHNIVSTFQQLGYLQKQPNGKYTLGLKMLEYAYIINQHLGYPKAVYDILLETASQTNQVVYFGLPYGTDVLYLYVAHPISRMNEQPYREMLGERAPMCATGIGRAILAHMPEEEWPSRIPKETVRYTPNTITEPSLILEELRRTKRRGYGIDNCERDINIRCVGVPIYNGLGTLVGGISTSGPAHAMTDSMILECANILHSSALKMKSRIYR